MQRRTVLKIVALSALRAPLEGWSAVCPAHADGATAWYAADYKPQFFSPAENELVDHAMELIIPADSHSGGAHAAKVSLFADRLLMVGKETHRTEWRNGLKLMADESSKSSLADALAKAAAGEANPQTDLERFFISLKQMTGTGYYASEIGIHQEMEYEGNTYLAAFPGCVHPQHQ